MPSEQLRKRLDNQSAILRALHFNSSMRRGEISSSLSIRKSSITSIISGLLDVGIVREVEPGHMRSALELDRDTFYVAVANITPREIRVTRVYLSGKVEEIERQALRQTAPATPARESLKQLGATFLKMKEEGGKNLLGFGLSMPGHIDPAKGVCLKATNLPTWQAVEVSAILEKQLGTSVLVENDVRSQLWGTSWFDRLADASKDVIYVAIHDGVACAILSGGQQVVGQHYAAGEIGTIRVGDEGRTWPNGVTDCLEAYASLPALLGTAKTIAPNDTLNTAADLAAAAKANPEIAAALAAPIGKVAMVLAGFVAALDPNSIVLGTPDRGLSELLGPILQKSLYSENIGDANEVDIQLSAPVEEGAIRGIAGLVIQHAFRHAPQFQDTRIKDEADSSTTTTGLGKTL